MKKNIKSVIIIIFLILCHIINISCKKQEVKEDIIAKVGSKSISVKDLKFRAEFTIRPSRFYDKDVVLNNLIAEKLFVMELPEDNTLVNDENYQRFIKGIKEQGMREELYYKEASNKVVLDSAEIAKSYHLSGYEYTVQFYRISKKSMADTLKKHLNTNDSEYKSQVFDELEKYADKKPVHNIKWDDPDSDVIHDALFSEQLKLGTVVGPLQLAKNDYIVMKIIDYSFTPTIGKEESLLKWHRVQEKLKQKKARKLWSNYIHNLMKGKEIKFDKEVFNKLSDLFYENYRSQEDMSDINIYEKILTGDTTSHSLNILSDNVSFLDQEFFTIDNKSYTVKDFRNLNKSHPLVYRKEYSNKKNFKQQFKLAVADLVRDHYLNQEAYNKSLDQNYQVKKKVNTWEDAIKARYQMNEYLKSVKKRKDFDQRLMKGDHNYISIYADSLYNKYKNSILINLEEYKKIRLTKLPLVAMQMNVPYPIALPNFPTYTTKSDIDHYNIMEKK